MDEIAALAKTIRGLRKQAVEFNEAVEAASDNLDALKAQAKAPEKGDDEDGNPFDK
jgi:hypothetical protein